MTRSPISAQSTVAFGPIEASRPMRTSGPMTALAPMTVPEPIWARGPMTAPGSTTTPGFSRACRMDMGARAKRRSPKNPEAGRAADGNRRIIVSAIAR